MRPSGVGLNGQVPSLCLSVLSGCHSYTWVRFPIAFGVLGSASPFAWNLQGRRLLNTLAMSVLPSSGCTQTLPVNAHHSGLESGASQSVAEGPQEVVTLEEIREEEPLNGGDIASPTLGGDLLQNYPGLGFPRKASRLPWRSRLPCVV